MSKPGRPWKDGQPRRLNDLPSKSRTSVYYMPAGLRNSIRLGFLQSAADTMAAYEQEIDRLNRMVDSLQDRR